MAVADGRFMLAPLLVVAYSLVVHMLTLSNARYSVPVLPYLLLFGAYGVRRLYGRYVNWAVPATS